MKTTTLKAKDVAVGDQILMTTRLGPYSSGEPPEFEVLKVVNRTDGNVQFYLSSPYDVRKHWVVTPRQPIEVVAIAKPIPHEVVLESVKQLQRMTQ